MDGEDNSELDMAIGIERERERSNASGCFGNSEQVPRVYCKVEHLPLTSVDERKTITSKPQRPKFYRKLGRSSKRPPPANTGNEGMVHILHFIEKFYP